MEIEHLSGTYAAQQLWQYWWRLFPNSLIAVEHMWQSRVENQTSFVLRDSAVSIITFSANWRLIINSYCDDLTLSVWVVLTCWTSEALQFWTKDPSHCCVFAAIAQPEIHSNWILPCLYDASCVFCVTPWGQCTLVGIRLVLAMNGAHTRTWCRGRKLQGTD